MKAEYRLVISCPNRVGIVAAVSGFLLQHNGNIMEASQHTSSGWIFMRYVIDVDSLSIDIDEFYKQFEIIAYEYSMTWMFNLSTERKRVALMVSEQGHCLTDLLCRWSSRELEFDIPCVISNHENLRDYVEWHGIPYEYVPIERRNKTASFGKVAEILDQTGADLVVLARYMQIIPAELCRRYRGRMINIHHSFLPSFAGARPYRQAYERGVKLIGASCHYVTEELDEGPIIEQDVVRVRHDDLEEDLVRLGRDVEKNVLSKGLRYHLEDRVLIHGNKTVVLN